MRNACSIFVLALFFNSSYSQSYGYSPGDTSVHYFWICKLRLPVYFVRGTADFSHTHQSLISKRKLLFTANGDLSYEHFVRNTSSDDLLLINSSSDIATLRLSVVYKETYPFSFSFRYNKAHPFQQDDQYELNLGFDERAFRQKLLDKTNSKLKAEFEQQQRSLTKRYQQALAIYQQQQTMLKSPAYAQRVVEERLRRNNIPTSVPSNPLDGIAGNNSLPGITDPLPGSDAIDQVKQAALDSLKAKAGAAKNNIHSDFLHQQDSLQLMLQKMEDSMTTAKSNLSARLDSAGRAVSENSLDKLKQSGDADEDGSPKKDKMAGLLMNSNIRLGKFLLTNSELTVNNIFLHGASIRYGTEKFIILSGGLYDFSFREVFNFRNDNQRQPKTTVFAVKLGKTDGRNLSAVTFYTGKKIKRGSVSDKLETVAGIGLEKTIYISRNLSLDMEVAKSTTLRNSVSEKDPGTIKDLLGQISIRTIGIYNSVRAYLPKTSTDAELTYRYWGQQFQSFNASQYFNPQNNFSGKISQPLFRRRLYIATGVKYTDFKSYGIASNIHTKALFASANATLRLKKLPIVSVGYYPGSQVYLLEQSKLYEYFYYIFNTTVSHYFRIGKMPVQIVLTRNKFFNKYTDSLVSGSQSYYNVYMTAWKNRFSYTANYSREETGFDIMNTIEAGVGYASRAFKLGGSVKGNTMDKEVRMGYSLNTGISFGKAGTINLIYDKSFLPSRNGTFIPVSMGQVQFIKPLKFSIWQ